MSTSPLSDLNLRYRDVVVVTEGPHAGRIAIYEDDDAVFVPELHDYVAEYADHGFELIPQFGVDDDTDEPFRSIELVSLELSGRLELSHYQFFVPQSCVRLPTMDDLVHRAAAIGQSFKADRRSEEPDWEMLFFLAEELALIEAEIRRRERREIAASAAAGVAAFLCHSSVDKPFVRRIYQDLRSFGMTAFLDEAEIRVGDSFVAKISDALDGTDHLVVVLSKDAVDSVWVKKEWQSFLTAQLSSSEVRRILPVLLEDCEVPGLLRDLHYADFRRTYSEGFHGLMRGLGITGKDHSD